MSSLTHTHTRARSSATHTHRSCVRTRVFFLSSPNNYTHTHTPMGMYKYEYVYPLASHGMTAVYFRTTSFIFSPFEWPHIRGYGLVWHGNGMDVEKSAHESIHQRPNKKQPTNLANKHKKKSGQQERNNEAKEQHHDVDCDEV